MTDAEILEKLRGHFQTKVDNLSGDEMAEGPFEDGTEDGELWEQAATVIDRRGGLRIRFEFADGSLLDRAAKLIGAVDWDEFDFDDGTAEEARRWFREYRVATCVDDATALHDEEETDAEREARFDAAALDVVARVSAGDPAHPFPYISEMAEGRPHDEACICDKLPEVTGHHLTSCPVYVARLGKVDRG